MRLLILLPCILFLSCKTAYVNLSVLEPSAVQIPEDIQNIGILNRTMPSQNNKVADNIDKVFSIEGTKLDEDGALTCLEGLETELSKNERFRNITTIEASNLKSPGSGIFPARLSWDEIDEICRSNDLDGLFVLEVYDTDTKVNYQANPVQMTTPFGTIPGIEHVASLQTNIKTGWRIYDPAGKMVLDQFRFDDGVHLTGRGINPMKAANAILGRKEAVMDVSRNLGSAYATRISPYWIRVSRTYFTNGNNNFKIGKRRANAGNWDGAEQVWLQETENRKGKLAGRACVNVAIIHEIRGDLNGAMNWASKAYEDYNNSTGLDYLKTLRNRANRQELLTQH